MPEGYTAELEGTDASYLLTVKGLSAELEVINAATIYGHVDIEEYMAGQGIEAPEPGVYEMEVSFQLSESITITQPVRVHIRISRTEES